MLRNLKVLRRIPQAFWQAGERRKNKQVPTDFLYRLMMLVLTLIIFEFNVELWLQKHETAIGTSAAPANLFMGAWEDRLLSEWQGTPPQFYRRFIDDLFMIWVGVKRRAGRLCKVS